MSAAEEADYWFERYGLGDVPRVSDPDKHLYRQFGLGDASLMTLAHPRVWWPWFRTAVLQRFGAGRAGANWRQLTGVFVVYRGRMLAAQRHRDSAARPEYVRLLHELDLRTIIR